MFLFLLAPDRSERKGPYEAVLIIAESQLGAGGVQSNFAMRCPGQSTFGSLVDTPDTACGHLDAPEKGCRAHRGVTPAVAGVYPPPARPVLWVSMRVHSHRAREARHE